MNGEDDLLEEDAPHKPDGVCILDEVCNWREEEDKKDACNQDGVCNSGDICSTDDDDDGDDDRLQLQEAVLGNYTLERPFWVAGAWFDHYSES